MNPKEWTRIGLIMEIRQVWRDYGYRLAKESLPEIVEGKAG